MATFKIIPIFLGKYNDFDISLQIEFASGQHRFISYGCLALINNDNGEITLLDTGFASKEEIEKYDLPWKCYFHSDRFYELKEELEKAGIRPEDVKQIGITHLHQDHCWNLDLFRDNVPIYVQKRELERAENPLKVERRSYQKIDAPCCPAWERGRDRFFVVDGDYEIEPGLKILFTPGHTYGSQSFLIDTEKGQYIYTGDQHMCMENVTDDAVIGWYNSLEDWYNSQEKIKATEAHILGTHMNETYESTCYG